MAGAAWKRRRPFRIPALASAALMLAPAQGHAACGTIATAFCVSAFSSAETPPGVGAIPNTGFSFLGPGAFAVTLTDPLSGKTGVNVTVTDGGEARATTGGLVTGSSGDGIAVSSASGPAVASIGAGGVLATGAGVRATSGGAGNVTVVGSGAINAGGTGIAVTTGGGNVFINETGKTTGATGISATTSGAGGLTIQTVGAVTGTAGNGVSATTQNGLDALIVGAGGVSGAVNGAAVGATGTGALSISLGGSATGTTGAGLVATTNSGASQITVNSGVTVSGGAAGMIVQSQSGASTIINNGGVLGGANAAFSSATGTGSSYFTNNSLLQGATAAANASGTMTVLNNATMDGAITTAAGATTSVNNVGTWTHAGGSTVSTFTNAGSLSLGPANGAPSTIAISGDATFTATSRWNPRLTATGSDKIAVGGSTLISGGTLAIAITPGAYKMGQAYQLITSTGALTGAFDHAYITGGFFYSTFVTAANGLSLTLNYGLLNPIAVTRNEKAVAAGLDAATRAAPTGAAGTLLSTLYSQSGSAPLATLDQMNADAPAAAVNANLAAGRLFTETITERQATLRALGDTPAARGDGWYTGATRPGAAAAQNGSVGVWSAGFGGVGAFAADKASGASSEHQSAIGAALGVDYRIAGVGFGVSGGVSDGAFSAGAASGTAQGVHVGAYVGVARDNLYLNASVTAARYTDATSRVTTAPALLGSETDKGKFGAREIRGRVEAGWSDQGPGMHIAPFAAVEVASLQTDRFTETTPVAGAGLMALAYAAQSTQSIPATLGLRLNGNFTTASGGVVTPKASVAWEYEFATKRAFNATLAALPTAAFTVAGAQPAGSALKAEIGFEAQLTRSVALFAMLDGTFSSNYRSISGRGGASVRW